MIATVNAFNVQDFWVCSSTFIQLIAWSKGDCDKLARESFTCHAGANALMTIHFVVSICDGIWMNAAFLIGMIHGSVRYGFTAENERANDRKWYQSILVLNFLKKNVSLFYRVRFAAGINRSELKSKRQTSVYDDHYRRDNIVLYYLHDV